MRTSAHRAMLALLTCLCFVTTLSAQAPQSKPEPAKTPQGSVAGRVTIKDKPAPGVVVGLRKNDIPNPYEPFNKAITDADGNYRITNVPTGSYYVQVSAPAYVPVDAADRKAVAVGEDENVEGLNFSLVRGGVITGKVVDVEGRPVVQHQVRVYNLAMAEKLVGQRLFPTSTAVTDDRGIYRVFGLLPGRYKAGAGRGEENYGSFSPTQFTYNQVFYPNVSDAAKATIIEVGEGAEAKDIDIILGRASPTFSVSGKIMHSQTGAPVPNLRLGWQRILGPGRTEFVSSFGVSNARGDFVVEGLIPGKYSPILFADSGNALRAEKSTLDVIDQDVSGVTIKVLEGAVISGVVVLETEDKSLQRQLSAVLLRGYVQAAPGFGNSVSSPIGPDGSFRLAGLPTGSVRILISGTDSPYPPKGFSISRIERDGMPAPSFEVKEGEQITGVRVFIGYGRATLRGTVNIENGSLAPGARVFVQVVRTGSTLFFRQLQVDDRGHFLLDGVAPGLYELTAHIIGGNGRPTKPVKREVSVVDNNATEITLTIDVSIPAGPQ